MLGLEKCTLYIDIQIYSGKLFKFGKVYVHLQNRTASVITNCFEPTFRNKLHVVVLVLYECHFLLYVPCQRHKLNRMIELLKDDEQ
jgi:hypothetical protein